MARQLKKSWHEALLQCASPHTEAPDKFLLWSAFSVVGAALKNRTYVKDGLYTLYPNQYIVLVAPPGIGKGTAIKFAWDIIRDTAPNFIANMVSDRVTAPRILERIANGWASAPSVVNQQLVVGSMDHTCTIYSTELRVLVTASDWMLEFLCESWDRNEYDYDTKNKGSAIITNMCTSLIGGTVPDYLKGIDKDSDISIKGGFTSRCVFIYDDKPSKNLPFPPPLDTNKDSVRLKAELKNDLQHISAYCSGEYTYDTAARLRFENFINYMRGREDDNEAVQHFKARIRAHVLKLAMVLTACRSDTPIITEIDMQNAIAYITSSFKDVERIFRGVGDSELAPATARVQQYIDKVGAASARELFKHMYRHMTIETLTRILFVLQEIGYLEAVSQGKITLYKVKQTKPGRKP